MPTPSRDLNRVFGSKPLQKRIMSASPPAAQIPPVATAAVVPAGNHTFIFHSPCPDGHLAAAIAWFSLDAETQDTVAGLSGDPKSRLGFPTPIDSMMFGMPIFWGTHPRYMPPRETYEGRVVHLLDVSFDEDKMRKLAEGAERVVVLDHHDTSTWLTKVLESEDRPEWATNIENRICMDKCGAEIAYDYFKDSLPKDIDVGLQELLAYTAARDLWQWEERREDARAVCLALEVEGVYDDLTKMTRVLHRGRRRFDELAEAGQACIQFRDQRVANSCKYADRVTLHIGKPPSSLEGGWGTDSETITLWAVNCTEDVSLVGNALAERKFADGSMPDAAAVYTVNINRTSVSLRAAAGSPLKLGQIAKALSGTTGGGGHDKAAGFSFRGTDVKAFLVSAPLPPPPKADEATPSTDADE